MNTKEIENRLSFLGDLLFIQSGCHIWSYDQEGILSWTTSKELSLNSIFCHTESFPYMLKYYREGNTGPLILSSPKGLVWGVSVENDQNGKIHAFHVVGPIFTQSRTEAEIRKELAPSITSSYMGKYVDLLLQIPVTSMTNFYKNLLMLHFTVTGEHLTNSDITMQMDFKEESTLSQGEAESNQNDRLRVYLAEQILLNMIRTGHMDKDQTTSISSVFTGTQKYSGNPVQHAKLSRALFAGQAAKAAIEGGVSTDIAYTRQDAYMQDLDRAKSLSEIAQLSITMFNDWVDLVHKVQMESKYSKSVQSCCDYVNTHLNEVITISTLAEKTGYADYYLSRKFRSEVGIGIDDYVKKAKIERAKVLLASSHMPVHEISEHLSFGTRNYFAEIFRKITGKTPVQYRKENQHF